MSDTCPVCGQSSCLVYNSVPPIAPDDVFDLGGRSVRAITGCVDSKRRVAVRNTVTNRLSYVPVFRLLKGQRRSERRVRDAAPELLAALKRSLNWLATYPGDAAINAYNDARDAIARAEGF